MKTILNVHPKYEHLTPYFLRLDELFEHSGTTIYKDRNEIKVMEWDGLLVNVKKYAVPHIVNRVVYTTLRKPKAVRAFNNAFILHEKGINSPEPIGYRLEQNLITLGDSYLVTIQMPSLRTLYELVEGDGREREEIIKALAKYAAKLHDSEVLHLDFSSGNVLYEIGENGEIKFTIVDINRMYFGPVSIRRGCASFARVWGDSNFLDILAESYAEARGEKNIEQVKKWIHQYHKKYWSRRSPHTIKSNFV